MSGRGRRFLLNVILRHIILNLIIFLAVVNVLHLNKGNILIIRLLLGLWLLFSRLLLFLFHLTAILSLGVRVFDSRNDVVNILLLLSLLLLINQLLLAQILLLHLRRLQDLRIRLLQLPRIDAHGKGGVVERHALSAV